MGRSLVDRLIRRQSVRNRTEIKRSISKNYIVERVYQHTYK